MWQINPTLTAVLFVPLLLSTFLTEALGSKTIAYRAASRAATGRLTGFLGELLRAQLAVKVAGAAPHAVARLSELGDARRRLAVRDSVFEQMLNAFSINIAHLGTGVVLLLGAHAIADGTFSVGDLALFVVYLDQLGWYPAEIGRLISDLKRIDVSYGRMREVVPGEPPAALVERGTGVLPIAAAARAARAARRARAQLHASRQRGRHRRRRVHPRARLVHRDHRSDRRGQDDAPACPARPAAARWRRDLVERAADRGSEQLLRAAAQRIHAAGAATVQRESAREHPARTSRRTGTRSRRRSTRQCSSQMWRRCSAGSIRWSGRAG